MAVAARRAPRGPTDPERRQRIAAAALEVALERGVPAVSHRSVAAVAGVPLGSTTYHFAGLDDLLAAAMRLAAERYSAELEDGPRASRRRTIWPKRWPTRSSPSSRMTADLSPPSTSCTWCRSGAPGLQPVTREWAQRMTDVLERHTDKATAYALSVSSDGALLSALVTGETPDRPTLVDLFGRIIAGA